MWWILGERLFHFFKFNTLALLIAPCLAENLPYFGKDMDLSLGYPAWYTLLRQLLIEYVTLLTNPEGPAPSAPSLTRQEVIQRDKARKEPAPLPRAFFY